MLILNYGCGTPLTQKLKFDAYSIMFEGFTCVWKHFIHNIYLRKIASSNGYINEIS